MNKKFLANLAFLVLANLMVKPFYLLGIEVEVQNTLGAATYGRFLALLNLSFIFTTFLDLGINQFNNRAIAQKPANLAVRFFPTFFLKLILGVFYWLAVLLFAFFLNYNLADLGLLSILLFNQILISMVGFNRSNLGGLHRFRLDGLASILDKLFLIFIIGFLLLRPEFNLYHFALGQTIAYGLTFLLTTGFVFYKNHLDAMRFQLKLADFKHILKESLPFATIVLMMGAYTRSDGIMLERMLTDEGAQAGLYGAAFRILDALNQLALLISYLLLPLFSRMLSEKKSVHSLFSGSLALVFAGACVATSVGFSFQNEIMTALYDEATPEYGSVFAALMAAFPAMAIMYVSGTFLTAANRMKALNIIVLSGLLLNFGLNLWFIPTEMAMGAALASCATQWLVSLLMLVACWQVLR